MEQPLVLLVALVLVSFCSGDTWTPPDFCQGPCPEYHLIQTHQEYEERSYVATNWITTKIQSKSLIDLMAAHSRLKDFCRRQNDAGHTFRDDTWPVLITVADNGEYWLSWFVPPGITLPENNDPSVSVQSRPEAKIYVRVFGGPPSLESGQENARALLKALGKDCTPTYSGAGYESTLALSHHNELWINADDISC